MSVQERRSCRFVVAHSCTKSAQPRLLVAQPLTFVAAKVFIDLRASSLRELHGSEWL